jgi:NADPH oxidase
MNHNGSTDRSPTLCFSSPFSTSLRITSSTSTLFSKAWITLTNGSFFNVERVQVRPQIALQIHYAEAGGITGHIMLLCMLLIYTTAHHRIRQQSFETFWYTHHLFIPFLLGMYTHATSCFVRDTAPAFSPFDKDNFWTHCIGYEGWRWELVGGGLYLCDRLYREIRSRRETQIVKVVRHPYGKFPTLLLNF